MRVDIPVGLQLLFERVSYAAVEEDGTSGRAVKVFDDLDKVVLMLYFFMVAHKTACQTLLKAFLKSMKTCDGNLPSYDRWEVCTSHHQGQ